MLQGETQTHPLHLQTYMPPLLICPSLSLFIWSGQDRSVAFDIAGAHRAHQQKVVQIMGGVPTLGPLSKCPLQECTEFLKGCTGDGTSHRQNPIHVKSPIKVNPEQLKIIRVNGEKAEGRFNIALCHFHPNPALPHSHDCLIERGIPDWAQLVGDALV